MSETASVVFTPSGLRGEVPIGATLLDAARALGADLDSVCGGRGICGRCQVVPTFGEFAKHAITSTQDHVSDYTETEQSYHGRRPIQHDARLGCAARILGDLVIDVPAASQIHRPVIRKSVDLAGLVVDPIIRLYYVVVEESDLGGERSDLRLLLDALSEQWSLDELTMDIRVLADLQPALTEGKRSVTVAVHSGRRIVSVWPSFNESAYGVAIDVGSTTVAGHLCDLATGEVMASAGLMNPQIRFGEDLMSRVSYVMMNPGGERELTAAIRQALNEVISQLIDQANIDRRDVLDVVLVGNPIMHHLFLGIDPTPLGVAPFTLTTDLPVDGLATDIEIDCPRATLHVLPCIAGHVGADTTAAVLAVGPHRSEEITLLIDVGTNAEIVLGNMNGLLAASSPTGPAFEGAQISCGQRATTGAIERVRIDRETLEPRLKIIGCDVWSDDPTFAEKMPDVGITGICGSGIIEAIGEMYLTGILDQDGLVDPKAALRTPRVVLEGRTYAYVLHDSESGPLRVTQNDVRAIQLGKGALFAGARLLMDRAGLETVDNVKLAGAFGSHIDPIYALVLGMVPDCDPSRVTSVGNAAGSGAVRALLSAESRQEVAEVARTITKVETAVEPAFQAHFVEAMGIPHATDPYARLAKVVQLPPRVARVDSSGGGRTRRRQRSQDPQGIAPDPQGNAPEEPRND